MYLHDRTFAKVGGTTNWEAKGESQCTEKIYRAALKAAKAKSSSDQSSHGLNYPAKEEMIWFRIRKAGIPRDHRQMFERFGATIITTALYGGFPGPADTAEPLNTLYNKPYFRASAAEWLTEQYDRAERKETWSITMEAAITVLVAVELVFSILNFLFHKG